MCSSAPHAEIWEVCTSARLQDITTVITIHSDRMNCMNECVPTIFHINTCSLCWDISVWTTLVGAPIDTLCVQAEHTIFQPEWKWCLIQGLYESVSEMRGKKERDCREITQGETPAGVGNSLIISVVHVHRQNKAKYYTCTVHAKLRIKKTQQSKSCQSSMVTNSMTICHMCHTHVYRL